MEILPDVDVSYDPAKPLRIAAIVHIFYEDMTDELLDRLRDAARRLRPVRHDDRRREGRRDPDDPRAAGGRQGRATSEIRVLPSNRGRDLSAFFIGCRDVLAAADGTTSSSRSTRRRPSRTRTTPGRYFKRQQLDNLLHSPGYAANVVALFQKEPGLGIVFPPDDPHRLPDDGSRLVREQGPAPRVLCEGARHQRAVRRHLAARPLRLHVDRPAGGARDPHRSRLEVRGVRRAEPAHATAASRTCRSGSSPTPPPSSATTRARSSTREHAAISHTSLEYKLDQMGATMPGYPIDQIQFLHRAGWLGHGGIVALTRVYLKLNHPRIAAVARAAATGPPASTHALAVAPARTRQRKSRSAACEEVDSDLAEGQSSTRGVTASASCAG